jgi:AraC family L-rhamnose operon regulatory protein RhaS
MLATSLAPIYRTGSGTFVADTCKPLTRAAARGDLHFSAVARSHYPGVRAPRGWLPGLCSVGLWDATRDQDWGLDWHRNEGIEITYLQRGSLPFASATRGQKRSSTLRPGTMTITRPWQAHRVGSPSVTPSRLHWIILDVGVRRPHQAWRWPAWLTLPPDDVARLEQRLRGTDRCVFDTTPELRSCFNRIAHCHRSESPGGKGSHAEFDFASLGLEVGQLIVHVLRALDSRPVRSDPALSTIEQTVRLFLDDLPSHLAEPWTLPVMARECGLAQTRFAHYCRRLTGLSPGRYLTRCRVERAAQLLRERPDLSITAIAQQTGFGSSQYFATSFKRLTRTTPKQWRHPEGD